MTTVAQTNEIPGGLYRGYQFDTEAAAVAFAAGRVSYLYHSRVIETMYILYIPVAESETI